MHVLQTDDGKVTREALHAHPSRTSLLACSTTLLSLIMSLSIVDSIQFQYQLAALTGGHPPPSGALILQDCLEMKELVPFLECHYGLLHRSHKPKLALTCYDPWVIEGLLHWIIERIGDAQGVTLLDRYNKKQLTAAHVQEVATKWQGSILHLFVSEHNPRHLTEQSASASDWLGFLPHEEVASWRAEVLTGQHTARQPHDTLQAATVLVETATILDFNQLHLPLGDHALHHHRPDAKSKMAHLQHACRLTTSAPKGTNILDAHVVSLVAGSFRPNKLSELVSFSHVDNEEAISVLLDLYKLDLSPTAWSNLEKELEQEAARKGKGVASK
jgi:hypothetical protein